MILRYVELSPDKIFNWLNPINITCWNAYPEFHNTWWEKDTLKIRKKFGEIWTEEFDKITGHFTKLEESILKDGILHPINCVTGHPRDMYLKEKIDINHFPPWTHENIKDVVYSQTFGGSRLTIARKHNIKVPCVIHDFSNLFDNCEEVNIGNYKKWFGDNYSFLQSAPHIRLHQHSHISTGIYSGMTQETRKAQNLAVLNTKEIIDV